MKAPDLTASESTGDVAAADTDLTVLQQMVGYHVHMFDFVQYQKFYEKFGDRAFTPAVYSALAVIGQNPGVRHGALADALMIQRPNLTALLNDLERKGYVSRRPSSTDKRSVALYLTDRGERTAAKMREAMLTLDHEMTAALSPQERRMLLGLLQKSLNPAR